MNIYLRIKGKVKENVIGILPSQFFFIVKSDLIKYVSKTKEHLSLWLILIIND